MVTKEDIYNAKPGSLTEAINLRNKDIDLTALSFKNNYAITLAYDPVPCCDSINTVMAKLRKEIIAEEVQKPVKMHPTNCKNCGAPLKSNKCEYCESVF